MISDGKNSGHVEGKKKVGMRMLPACLLIMLCIFHSCAAGVARLNEMIKVTPDTTSAFKWPYYLYIPTAALDGSDTLTVLVQPNNTGKCSDDYSMHDNDAMRVANNLRSMCDRMAVVLLIPAFPRPMEHWQIYTHALDRDALFTDLPGLKRLDLQLIAMIEDARQQIRDRSCEVDDRVLMMGYSAAGMFVNRFAVMHPEMVKAVVCGSPGGWPIAPLGEWEGERLRYPVGIADIEEISGIDFDPGVFADVPLFLYLGDQDTNDAVAFDDGFDVEDRDLINRLFGEKPVSRWPSVEAIYRQANPGCQLKLYAGEGHGISDEMWKDIRSFLTEHR